jgi:peptidoglycan/LPS O-acetylase OafA/YrhL
MRKMSLEQQRRFWVIFFTVIILAAFILPFYLFDDLPKIYGAFLFWCIFAVVAIIGVGVITSKWRE